jgi:hypothetical protein
MNFLGFFMRNLNSKIILMRVLIIFMLLAITLPVENYDVIAQEPDNPQTVYLPLVVKNSMSTCADGPDQWLCLFNQYRITSGLNPVTSNSSYNYGLGLHIQYMLLNPFSNVHEEDPKNPGYTSEGSEAGKQSNMATLIGGSLSVKGSIDLWMGTERHRYHMLNPDLVQSGFSLAYDGTNSFAGINILQGLQIKDEVRAVVYPGNNQSNIPASQFPISMGFYPSHLISSIIVSNASLYDSSNRPIPGTTTIINDYVKEVVFKPNSALLPNQTYRIVMNITAGGKTFNQTWYFTTGSQ